MQEELNLPYLLFDRNDRNPTSTTAIPLIAINDMLRTRGCPPSSSSWLECWKGRQDQCLHRKKKKEMVGDAIKEERTRRKEEYIITKGEPFKFEITSFNFDFPCWDIEFQCILCCHKSFDRLKNAALRPVHRWWGVSRCTEVVGQHPRYQLFFRRYIWFRFVC